MSPFGLFSFYAYLQKKKNVHSEDMYVHNIYIYQCTKNKGKFPKQSGVNALLCFSPFLASWVMEQKYRTFVALIPHKTHAGHPSNTGKDLARQSVPRQGGQAGGRYNLRCSEQVSEKQISFCTGEGGRGAKKQGQQEKGSVILEKRKHQKCGCIEKKKRKATE